MDFHDIEKLKVRFLDSSLPQGDCRIWIRTLMPKTGYGCFSIRRKTYTAHRLAWRLFVGEIPQGLFVCHRCNNKACVKIEHLYLADNRQNQLDAWRDGLGRNQNVGKTACPKGHPLSGENLFIIKSTGSRSCRECRRIQGAESMRRCRAARKANAIDQTVALPLEEIAADVAAEGALNADR